MAAIEPAVRSAERFNELLRHGTRALVVACYVAAVIVAVVLVRPAFRDVEVKAATVGPAAPVVQQADVLREHETIATFAARHGLELGDLLALNPSIDSLTPPPGTKLRVG